MGTELLVLLLTLVLGLIHLGIPSFFRVQEVGNNTLVGARDNLPDIQNVKGQRANRANANFKETLPWALALLVLAQTLPGKANSMTAMGAWIYFGARCVYLPLYILGVPVARTLAFGVSLAGLTIIALQLM